MNQIKTWQQRQAETGIGSVEAKDDEIRELRQAIEQAERVEPVGSVVEDGEDFGHVKALLDQDARVQLAVGTKLYTHPPTAPAQQPLNDFDMRGVLASKLLCWHRLTEAEAQDLVCFFENVRRTGASL